MRQFIKKHYGSQLRMSEEVRHIKSNHNKLDENKPTRDAKIPSRNSVFRRHNRTRSGLGSYVSRKRDVS